MHLEEYLQMVSDYVEEYDRPSAIKLFRELIRENASLDGKTVRRHILEHMPQAGEIGVSSILRPYGFPGYSEVARAIKWLRQEKEEIKETLCGFYVTDESAEKLCAFLESAIPVRDQFDEFCCNRKIEPTNALFTDFLSGYKAGMYVTRYHPFSTESVFWRRTEGALKELFDDWYAEVSADFSVTEPGYLSITDAAVLLEMQPKMLLTWLRQNREYCRNNNGQWLLAVTQVEAWKTQWDAAVPVLTLLQPKLEQVPYKFKLGVKEAVMTDLRENKPEWLLPEGHLPQQKAGVLYTYQPLTAERAMEDRLDSIATVPLGELKSPTGITVPSLKRKVLAGAITAEEHGGNYYVSPKEIRRVGDLNRRYVVLDTIVERCIGNIETCFNCSKIADRNNLIDFCEQKEWWDIPVIRCENQPIDGKQFELAVYRDDSLKLADYLELWLARYRQPAAVQFDLLLNKMGESYPDTSKKLARFEQTKHKTDNALVDMTQLLYESMNKELKTLSDIEIEKQIVSRFNEEASLIACKTLSAFLTWGGYTTRQFEFAGTGYEVDVSAYSIVDFAVMIWHVVNDEVIQKEDLVRKAVGRKKYADLWLFFALHVFASWRSTDYIRILPPRLPYAAEVTLEKVLSGELSAEEARCIAEYFVALNRLSLNTPHKTEGTVGVPKLYFYCPESCLECFGRILAIATAHYALQEEAKSFVMPVRDIYAIKQFFGDDFAKACGNKAFSGRRANKALMQSVEYMGREEKHMPPLVAYHLPSLMRSHKLEYGKPSDVTDIYLRDAKFSGLTPEFIAFQMFERGVCSFVTSSMMKICYGERFTELPVTLQTDAIKSLAISPAMVSDLLRCVQLAQDRACETAMEVCGNRETMEYALQAIALGHGTGKDPEGYCLLKTVGQTCADKGRLSCLGCRFEIKTKALLLRYAVNHFALYGDPSGLSQQERQRREYLCRTITYPAIAEILRSLTLVTAEEEMSVYRAAIEEAKGYGITGSGKA